jgi:delta24-sterol reductase
MNIGLYGVAKDLPESNLDLQRLVAKLGGKAGLYAHTYANRDEFWTWYDHEEYTRLRKIWDGNVFMDLWDKVAGGVFSKSTVDK